MLDKKRIMITGANGTLGSIISKKLYENNADLVLLYRQNDNNIKNLISNTNDIETHKIDLLHTDKLQETLEKITNTKSIDIFIHCPVLPIEHKSFLDTNWTNFQNHIDLQTKSFLQISQHIVPFMKEKKSGKIIPILSSYLIGRPPPSLSPYVVSKYSLMGLVKLMAVELGQYGITVNNVLPGATGTERLTEIIKNKSAKTGSSEEEAANTMKNAVPAKRFAKPEELADAITFLASERAAYINGINLPVDGGRTKSL